MKAAAKFRFYPTPKQETLLMQSFGCVRKVWNMMLDACKKNYKQTGKFLNAQELFFFKYTEYSFKIRI